jgi:putative transposase
MSTPGHTTVLGASYFVTTKCWEGRSLFQVTEVAEILLNTLLHYRDSGAYSLHEFVIIPDHLHLMLTSGPETSLEKAVQLIKGGSSHRIHKERGGKMEIWQVGFHDWTIRDLDDWKAKVSYIRMNPVKARLSVRGEDWAYSSANRKFCMDPIPEKYQNLASGAKAQFVGTFAQGLKPLPPKETAKAGPKGPTPGASTGASSVQRPFEAQGRLKPLPPKERLS